MFGPEWTRRNISWLWRPRFLRGALNLIVGEPGVGKSLLLCRIAAHITTGTPWPDGTACPRGNVVFATVEDDVPSVVLPCLELAGANLAAVDIRTAQDLPLIARAARDCQAVAILLDPLTYFLRHHNSWVDTEVRRVLSDPIVVAQELDTAVIGLMHLNKAEQKTAINRVTGSGAFVAVSRACFVAERVEGASYTLTRLKANRMPVGVSTPKYRIISDETGDNAFVEWDGFVESVDTAPLESDDSSTKVACREWLRDLVTDNPMRVPDIMREARKVGFAPPTVYNTAGKLRVSREKQGHGLGSCAIWWLGSRSPIDPLPDFPTVLAQREK